MSKCGVGIIFFFYIEVYELSEVVFREVEVIVVVVELVVCNGYGFLFGSCISFVNKFYD